MVRSGMRARYKPYPIDLNDKELCRLAIETADMFCTWIDSKDFHDIILDELLSIERAYREMRGLHPIGWSRVSHERPGKNTTNRLRTATEAPCRETVQDEAGRGEGL